MHAVSTAALQAAVLEHSSSSQSVKPSASSSSLLAHSSAGSRRPVSTLHLPSAGQSAFLVQVERQKPSFGESSLVTHSDASFGHSPPSLVQSFRHTPSDSLHTVSGSGQSMPRPGLQTVVHMPCARPKSSSFRQTPP
jgi:hypothetical protein